MTNLTLARDCPSMTPERVTRYNSELEPSPTGGWVSYKDYQLKLKQVEQKMDDWKTSYQDQVAFLVQERDALQAQIEATKAALQSVLSATYNDPADMARHVAQVAMSERANIDALQARVAALERVVEAARGLFAPPWALHYSYSDSGICDLTRRLGRVQEALQALTPGAGEREK